MTGAEFRAAIARLGLSQVAASRLCGVSDRAVRRWVADDAGDVPASAAIILRQYEQIRELSAREG